MCQGVSGWDKPVHVRGRGIAWSVACGFATRTSRTLTGMCAQPSSPIWPMVRCRGLLAPNPLHSTTIWVSVRSKPSNFWIRSITSSLSPFSSAVCASTKMSDNTTTYFRNETQRCQLHPLCRTIKAMFAETKPHRSRSFPTARQPGDRCWEIANPWVKTQPPTTHFGVLSFTTGGSG